MSPNKDVVHIVLGFIAILGISASFGAGFWFGYSGTDNMHFLLISNKNIEAILNIAVLNGLEEKQIETMVEFMRVRVKVDLKYEGIEPATIAKALEYQRKYCKTPCLGLE
jgi:hypothetical protein